MLTTQEARAESLRLQQAIHTAPDTASQLAAMQAAVSYSRQRQAELKAHRAACEQQRVGLGVMGKRQAA